MTRYIGIILAGGSGSRMGSDKPKQYLTLAGRTVLEHSIEAFATHPLIDEVAVVVAPAWHDTVQGIIDRCGHAKVKRLLHGGKERTDSSLAAIRAYEGQDVCLLFHDAARPLVTARCISDVCRALQSHEAVATGIASVDTLMQTENGCIKAVPPRSQMQRMQTPQAFRLSTIAEAYRLALADPHFAATDDCGIVMRYLPHVPIAVVEGDACALKLTFPDDLLTLERMLATRQPADASHSPGTAATTSQQPNLTAEGRNRYVRRYHQEHLRAMQEAELDILRHVAALCQRHGIAYWLDSGTLLGAIRHGGFIPWDDDIDICMPLTDVPRFIEVAQHELPPHLFVQAPQTDPSMRLPICKVRNLNSLIVEGGDDFSRPYAKGLYIDIFPMLPWPTLPYKLSKRLAKGYCRANAILQAQHTYSWRSVAELFYFGTKRALLGAAWRLACVVRPSDKFYSNTLNNSGNGNRHLRSTIFPLGTVQFEGETFSAPADCDTYLRDLFGEYHTLPPVEARQGHATFFATRLTANN